MHVFSSCWRDCYPRPLQYLIPLRSVPGQARRRRAGTAARRAIPVAGSAPGLKFTASPSCRLPFYRQRFSMPDRLSCSKNRIPPGTQRKSGMQSIDSSSSRKPSFLLPVSEFFLLHLSRHRDSARIRPTMHVRSLRRRSWPRRARWLRVLASFTFCPAAHLSRPAACRHPGYRAGVRDSVRYKEPGFLTARRDRCGNNTGRVHRNELQRAAIGTGNLVLWEHGFLFRIDASEGG